MNNKLIIKENYEEMSKEAAAIMRETIEKNPNAILVFATGHSPQRAYQILVQGLIQDQIDISCVTFVKLDEWMGLAPENEATCEYFLQKEIIQPLHVKESQYLHFNALAKDINAECQRFRDAFALLPCVDLVILGIGKNGHLGLNEPAEELTIHTHIAALTAKTKTHEMLTHTKEQVSFGVTMGLQEIFCGKKILLLADGRQKAEMLQYYLGDKISTRVPVSLLKLHPDCTCVVNREDFPEDGKKND